MIIGRFLRDEKGISSIEFTLVAAVFLLIMLSVIDFCVALWEWNMAAYATRVGARQAVVSDLASISLRTLDGTQYAAIGNSIPVASFPSALSPKYCTVDGCGQTEATANDSGDLDMAAFMSIVNKMKQHYGRITANDVVIKYEHVGLGLAGNPVGPDLDPMITVSLRNVQYTFMSPGLALIGPKLLLPPFTTSFSGEDGEG